jgi:hypothetical protein
VTVVFSFDDEPSVRSKDELRRAVTSDEPIREVGAGLVPGPPKSTHEGRPYASWFGDNVHAGDGKPSPYAEGPLNIEVTRAVDLPRSELFLMLGNKFADCGDKIMGDLHYGVVLFHECRFILGHRFFRRLLLVVREGAPNSLFVPSGGKSILVHIRLVRLRLR